MDYKEIETHLGTNQGAIAKHFGVKQPAVASWKKKGVIPPRRVAEFNLWLLNQSLEAPAVPPSAGDCRSS